MTFQSFNFDPRVAAGVQAQGYRVPTPIQQQAIPPILLGRDVMGLAQTGTGKTAAFVLPLLQRLLNTQRGMVHALILSPTRELAEQTHEAINVLGSRTGLHSMTVYGGVSASVQTQKLRQGVDIVVACPGRLLDHLQQGTISLSNLDILVLDEADMMFDMGFLPDIRRILRVVPTQRQTLLFSATMPPDIRRLAQEVLRDPVTIQIGHTEPIATVSHALYPVAGHLKTALLMALLAHTDTESVLVFARTKYRAKRVGEQLGKAGYRVASLQGNLSQNRRQEALDGFRDGTYQILVATDIAARGIDVSQISHVINYDIPDTAEAYTHRIGRTGRAARTGDAFTLVTDEDTEMVRAIERLLGQRVEVRRQPGFDYDVAAPARNTEFARPPREVSRRPRATEAAAPPAAPRPRRTTPAPTQTPPAPERRPAPPASDSRRPAPVGQPATPPAGRRRRRPAPMNNQRAA